VVTGIACGLLFAFGAYWIYKFVMRRFARVA